MVAAAREIENLIYTYAERIDGGFPVVAKAVREHFKIVPVHVTSKRHSTVKRLTAPPS